MGSLCSKCMEKKEDNTPAKNPDLKETDPNSSAYIKRFSPGTSKGTPELMISERDFPPSYDTYNNFLDHELKEDPYLNYDYSNNTTVYGRFSNLDDKSFEGFYDYSYDHAYIQAESKDILENAYISINSNSILIDETRRNSRALELDLMDVSNVLMGKKYLIVYFEMHYFMLWTFDYIKTIYPENNLVISVQLNDDITTTERIYLIKSEEKSKYKPMLKKQDSDKKSYRIVKFIPDEQSDSLHKKPIKLSIEISLFCNGKNFVISYEEFYFSSHSDTEMHRYILYPNTYMPYNNKKMGNLNFTFIFKQERLTLSKDTDMKALSSKYLHIFSRRDKLLTFSEDPVLQLEYNEISDCEMKSKSLKSNFSSLHDIQVEVFSCLRNESYSVDKLLELLSLDKVTKYEFFIIMKKLMDHLSKKEFDEKKLNIFKEKLYNILDEIKEKNFVFDKITIPFLINLIKRTFFKINKPLAPNKNKKVEPLTFNPQDIEMIKNIFQNCFYFINPEFGPEIAISALNYINKNIDDNFLISTPNDKRRVTSEEFFLNNIIVKKRYIVLCDLLLYMSDHQACALPITSILSKLLRNKKEEVKELIPILKQDRFKQVFKEMLNIHDCNSLIMTNLLNILLNLLDFIEIEELFQIVNFTKLKEIFNTFKANGFDLIHDSTISLIKAILIKKSSNDNKTALTLTLNDSDYAEIIQVFISAVVLIRTKIQMIADFSRLVKFLYNLLSHVYTICNIINNINEKNEIKAHQVCIEYKMPELIIECFKTLNDKKVFTCIDSGFERNDLNSVKTKMIIFRTLCHCILLIQNLRKIEPLCVTKFAAEKFYKTIKIIEDNDAIYNPQNIVKNYEKSNFRADDLFKTSVKNLLEYYNRYKQKLPEIAEELITILKS